jgi:hypothetical protein
MLAKLARALGVAAFQLLVPSDKVDSSVDAARISGLLRNLKQNIQDDINTRFNSIVKDE